MPDNFVIDTILGKIKGKHATNYLGDKYYSFQGIPYAKAPVGNLRFKAPQPIEAWSGELDATEEGQACPSMHMIFMWASGNEDNCLNLNIYIRELPKPDVPLKPVMVWIHGGAFLYGSNSTEFYGPEYLMTEDVIQVIINYRLGIFGFLCLEDESLGVTGNAGLKDQVMALQWVKDNISSFGGDPNNVTIYGQSAGGASVEYLILSPKAKGLFHKAIVQSGSVLCPWATGRRGAKHLTKYFNIEEEDETKILDALQRMTFKQILTAQKKVPERIIGGFHRAFAPVVEKPSKEAFLSEDPLYLIKSGNYNKVPMIIGTTSNEGAFYGAVKLAEKIEWFFDCTIEIPVGLKESLNTAEEADIVTKICNFYELHGDVEEESTYELKSDNLFVHPVHRSLSHHLESNSHPIYYYKFSFEGNMNHFKNIATSYFPKIYFICQYLANLSGSVIGKALRKTAYGVGFKKISGCVHGDEVTYLFGCVLSRQFESDSHEEKTMKRLVKLWTNFAKYSNPTPENDKIDLGIKWKSAEKDAHHYLDISDKLTMGVNPFDERKKFWDGIYKEYSKV